MQRCSSGLFKYPWHSNGMSGVIVPDSSAAIAVTILNVEPGGRTIPVNLGTNGRRVSLLTAFHRAVEPSTNIDRSNVGALAAASNRPESASITMMQPPTGIGCGSAAVALSTSPSSVDGTSGSSKRGASLSDSASNCSHNCCSCESSVKVTSRPLTGCRTISDEITRCRRSRIVRRTPATPSN